MIKEFFNQMIKPQQCSTVGDMSTDLALVVAEVLSVMPDSEVAVLVDLDFCLRALAVTGIFIQQKEPCFAPFHQTFSSRCQWDQR